MRKECYLIEFKVYHYNSGAADNHTGIHKIECDTYDEAILIKNRIDKLYDERFDYDDEENEDTIWYRDYMRDHTAVGGFFKSEAEIYKYIIEESKIKIN